MLNYHFATMQDPTSADGVIMITGSKQHAIASLFWGDEQGPLADYLAITHLTLQEGGTTYEITGGRCIPAGATRLICNMSGSSHNSVLEFILPKEKQMLKQQASYGFFLLSDIHGGGDYWQNKPNRDAAFSDAAEFSPSHIIISGDITNAGQPEHYEKVKADTNKFFPTTPVLFATGNHDYNSYRPDVDADLAALHDFFHWQTGRTSSLGVAVNVGEINYFSLSIGGILYIILNSSAPNNRFELGQPQLDWLEQELIKGDNNTLPSFVINHFPLKGKVGLHSLFGRQFIKDNDQAESLLNRHRCVYVSGHTHYNIDSEDSSVNLGADGEPTYINAGCAVWTQNGYDENGKDIYLPERCTGQYVEVYDNYLLIRGRDFSQKKFIPKCEYRISL